MIQRITPIQIAGGIGILTIVVVLIARTRRKAGPKNTVAPSNPTGIRPGFSAKGEAARFAQAFNSWDFWSSTRRNILNDLWRMSDAELAAVYNEYNANFAPTGETMLSVIQSEWIFGGEVDRVTNRLDKMGLS